MVEGSGLTPRAQHTATLLRVGESNAVFLRGVGGDAATSRTKPDVWGHPEEEVSGTHMDLNASIFKPGETIRVEAHDGEGGRSTVRIGRVRLVGCGEPQEGGRSTVRIGNDSEVIFPIMAGAKQMPYRTYSKVGR